MNKRSPRQRRQGGFTLVEMSVTMAAAGLLFAAVTTGQELVDQAKAAKLLNDVKTIEAQLQQHAQLKGRLPGDCNADGVIDFAANDTASRTDDGNVTRAGKYSYMGLLPTIPGDGAEATLQTDACTLLGSGTGTTPAGVTVTTASGTNANVWLNDLKLAGIVSDSAPNRTLAKLVHEDFAFVGHVTDAGGASAAGADYNAIVIHNVPQWMARRLATAINGQDARSDRSRVRQLSRSTADGDYVERWQNIITTGSGQDAVVTAEMRDAMVTIAYFFDRIPESKVETDFVAPD